MLENYTILCDSNIAWNCNRYSKHHLMSRFARRNDVIFVNPPVELGHRKTGSCTRDENLTVFTPFAMPMRSTFDIMVRLDAWFLTRQLRNLLRRADRSRLVLFLGNAWNTFLLDGIGKRACTVYHCSDNFPAFFSGEFAKHLKEREEDMIRRCDLVIATSELLRKKCSALNPNTFLIPNGVDESFFAKDGGILKCPDDLAAINSPRIGFTGSIDRLLDFDMISHAVTTLPEFHFVFIGPVDTDCKDRFARLLGNGNFHHLGTKNWRELPGYLSNFDLCILPRVRSEWVSASCPLKLVEYLAAGKRTVAAGINCDDTLRPGIVIADGAEEFTGLVRQAVQSPAGAGDRIVISQLVKGCGWDAKAEEYSSRIESAIENRRSKAGLTP